MLKLLTNAELDFAHICRDLEMCISEMPERLCLFEKRINRLRCIKLFHDEARRTEKIDHYTPKHGSWLNMAEIELSVLSAMSLYPGPSHLKA